MKKYIVTIIILFLIILVSVSGTIVYTNVKANEGGSLETLKEKAISEVDFLSAEIIDIMNGLNNIDDTNYKLVEEEVTVETQDEENSTSEDNTISQSVIEESGLVNEADEIDWTSIGENAETVYSSWTTVLIDLTTIGVDKENLLKFNDLLDETIEAISVEDKQETLNYAADLYNMLALYVNDFSDDEQIKNVYNTKANILYAYSLINSDNWESAASYMTTAIDSFNSIMNNQVNNISTIDEVNKAYILINELADDVSKNNKDTFYINYQNLMNELDNI